MSPEEADDYINEYGNGGYTVKRSSDRKGKTHVVIGPDGTKKYFGDSNLGQHPNDPARKKAFYARHKKNLAGNPYFRAFARKTWADGGEIDPMNFNYGGIAQAFDYGGIIQPMMYAKGGGIHIDPSKKGTFTAAATKHGKSVQGFAEDIGTGSGTLIGSMEATDLLLRIIKSGAIVTGTNLMAGCDLRNIPQHKLITDLKYGIGFSAVARRYGFFLSALIRVPVPIFRKFIGATNADSPKSFLGNVAVSFGRFIGLFVSDHR
jgi:hypothetical protein